MDGLHKLNTEIDSAAQADFLRCCGSLRWAMQMARRRPYLDEETLYATGEMLWYDLTFRDWLDAFNAHPKIGDRNALRKKFAATRSWSEGEQKGVEGASEETITQLVRSNRVYESKFGYIFIICAAGLSAEHILAQMKERMNHDQKTELMTAAAEQAKIIRLRLEKLISGQ